MELLLVVILVGIIAAFALPNYTKSMDKAHERDGEIQLTSIHSANIVYFAQVSEYLPTGTGNLTAINNGLNLGIIANDITYAYSRPTTKTYTATATWGGNTLRVNQTGTICCQSTGCPSIPDC